MPTFINQVLRQANNRSMLTTPKARLRSTLTIRAYCPHLMSKLLGIGAEGKGWLCFYCVEPCCCLSVKSIPLIDSITDIGFNINFSKNLEDKLFDSFWFVFRNRSQKRSFSSENFRVWVWVCVSVGVCVCVVYMCVCVCVCGCL